MTSRPATLLLMIGGVMASAPGLAIAQELEEPILDEASGASWTLPALIVVVALAALALFLVWRRRHAAIPSLDDRLPPAPDGADEVAGTVVRAPVGATDSGASSEVLRLLNNPAVSPTPSGAADLAADPWT